MKIPVFLVALVGALAANAQQASYPSNMPPCGVTCGNNMFAQAENLNCTSSSDYACMCNNPDFLYGVHDCSYEYCQNNTAANIAIAWGNSFCGSNSGTITVPSVTGTYSGNGTSATASTPTATTVLVETITSGSSVFVTTVSSTLFGPAPGAATTTPSVSTGTSGGSSFTTTLGTSITSQNSGGTTTGSSSSGSSSSSSSSSSGAAPRMTAGSVAGLLAAGFAAALL